MLCYCRNAVNTVWILVPFSPTNGLYGNEVCVQLFRKVCACVRMISNNDLTGNKDRRILIAPDLSYWFSSATTVQIGYRLAILSQQTPQHCKKTVGWSLGSCPSWSIMGFSFNRTAQEDDSTDFDTVYLFKAKVMVPSSEGRRKISTCSFGCLQKYLTSRQFFLPICRPAHRLGCVPSWVMNSGQWVGIHQGQQDRDFSIRLGQPPVLKVHSVVLVRSWLENLQIFHDDKPRPSMDPWIQWTVNDSQVG